MNCPDVHDWDLLAMEVLPDGEADCLRAHMEACPACRGRCEQARRSHLDRVRMYDQFDQGHDSLREQLMAALPPEPDRSRTDRLVRGWRHMRDYAMSIKQRRSARAVLGLVSAAACIGLVVIIANLAGDRSAFAEAIKRFQTAQTIVCRVSTSMQMLGMNVQQNGKLYSSAEHGSRMELFQGETLLNIAYSSPTGPMIMVTPAAKQYMVMDAQGADPSARGQTSPDALIRALAKLRGRASRELGQQSIDGVNALGFEISGEAFALGTGENVTSELWIDTATYLPVRYVANISGIGGGGDCQMIFDQFEWDTPLDPQLFVPDIPEGYTRIDARLPALEEAVLVKALGTYVELTGKHPSRMSMSAVMDLSVALGRRLGEAAARGEKIPDQQEMTQKGVDIGAGIAFYQKLEREGRSPEYHGKTVSPGDAHAVLVRWKLPSGESRVIYGDLRIETVVE